MDLRFCLPSDPPSLCSAALTDNYSDFTQAESLSCKKDFFLSLTLFTFSTIGFLVDKSKSSKAQSIEDLINSNDFYNLLLAIHISSRTTLTSFDFSFEGSVFHLQDYFYSSCSQSIFGKLFITLSVLEA